MKSTEHGIEESKAVENMYHMRLMALLQELVRKRGPKGAARVLEIDPKTVAESVKTGQLSRRTRDSLERALQEGVGSAAAQQRERNEKLEGRVDALEKGHDELGKELRRRMASVEGTVAALGRDGPQGSGAGHAGAAPSPQGAGEAEAGASDRDGKPPTKPSMRREYPDLATLEPADDDEEIFGAAWPLIVEWRELLDAHPERGEGVEWLITQERVLGGRAGPARRPRDDPAAREAAAAGLRPERSDHLAQDRALRHAERAEEGRVQAQCVAHPDPAVLAEMTGAAMHGSAARNYMNFCGGFCDVYVT